MRTAASGLASPKVVALATPREAHEDGRVLGDVVVARGERLPDHLLQHGEIQPAHLHAAVLQRGLQGVPEGEGVDLLLLEGEPARGAHAHGQELHVFLGVDAHGGHEGLGDGHRARGKGGDADGLAPQVGDLLERAVRRHHETVDGLARLHVEALDLDSLLPPDEDLLGPQGHDLDVAAAELLEAGRRALHARHSDIESLLLPVAERLGHRRMRGMAHGDVLRGHREDHLLEGLVLSEARGAPDHEHATYECSCDALHERSSLISRLLKRVQMRGGARRSHARRTPCTLSVRPRAPTKQMGPFQQPARH